MTVEARPVRGGNPSEPAVANARKPRRRPGDGVGMGVPAPRVETVSRSRGFPAGGEGFWSEWAGPIWRFMNNPGWKMSIGAH